MGPSKMKKLLCVLMVVAVPAISNADVTENLFYDLAIPGSLDTWQEITTGGGTSFRSGIHLTSADRSIFYAQDFTALEDGNAWVVQAVLSTTLPPAPPVGSTASGVGFAIDFRYPAMVGELFQVEVQFLRESNGDSVITLRDIEGGVELARLDVDYSEDLPRFRVRVRWQQIGGTDYLFLEAEPSDSFPVPGTAITDDPPNRAVVNMSVLIPANSSDPAGVRFGNLSPIGSYQSSWESVHLIFTDDPTTLLPVWLASAGTAVPVGGFGALGLALIIAAYGYRMLMGATYH